MASDSIVIVLYVVIFIAITIVLTKLCKRDRTRHYEIPARDITKTGHRWAMVEIFSQPTYSAVTGDHIVDGAFCDSCGICVEDDHLDDANKRFPCKSYSRTRQGELKHHWIEGNLPLCSYCAICQQQCGVLPRLCDYRCCWCQMTVHEDCLPVVPSECRLGKYRDLIVPPNCVQLKLVGWKGRRHLIVGSVSRPDVANWSPLIVIANRKSGNNDGAHILQFFRGQLNPAQVIDLHDLPPEAGLEWCHLIPDVRFRVLVCGGDGTVGWVLNAINQLKLKPAPHVGILPLGTGNDLSRVLGSGEGHVGHTNIHDIMDTLEAAKPVKLDRWKIEILNTKRLGIGFPRQRKVLVMNNYFSVGVDALVTLNFHRRRESWPKLFGSRIINKMWYFTYGTKDVLERECKDLEKKIKLEMDGKLIALPPIEGIVVLNIESWGGGCKPWNIGGQSSTVPKSAYDDGLVEVMGLYSSFHIAQLQVGLAEPLRFGQAKQVKITLMKGRTPMQADGEPWNQSACEITINHSYQANMLAFTELSQTGTATNTEADVT
ncbi:diacylglycerol kinase epsilon-like [Tubulanus polymorphus]|uniref:diacylglycerol kinase epsilon-like n=1 Tax=Tubulanus polymorphus TaxID=672921 RepID=UPI003DA27D71